MSKPDNISFYHIDQEVLKAYDIEDIKKDN